MRFFMVRQFAADNDGHRFQFAGDRAWQIQGEAAAWCAEAFGVLPDRGQIARGTRWWTNGCHFWFRDADDAFQFRIRWG